MKIYVVLSSTASSASYNMHMSGKERLIVYAAPIYVLLDRQLPEDTGVGGSGRDTLGFVEHANSGEPFR